MYVSRFADLNNPLVFDQRMHLDANNAERRMQEMKKLEAQKRREEEEKEERRRMQEKLAEIADRQTQRDVAAAYGQIIPFNSNDFLGYV